MRPSSPATEPPTRRSRLEWLPRVLLAGVSLTLALAAAELLIGRWMPSCAQDLYETDERVGWTLVPGLRTTFAPCSHPWSTIRTRVETNELGMRDPPRESEKPTGVFRILVLGDSFTEAMQVEREESFVARLERLLNERRAALPPERRGDAFGDVERIEVLNAGVSGYGTDNELLAFRERYASLDADLVILVMSSENDVYENSRAMVEDGPMPYPDKPYFEYGADGSLVLRNQPVPRHEPPPPSHRVALEEAVRGSALYRTLTGRPPPMKRRDVRMLGGRGKEGNPLVLQHYLEDDGPAWAEARALTGALVDQLDREVSETGARLAIVVLPDKRAMHPELLEYMLGRSGLADRPHRSTAPYEKLLAVVSARDVPSRGLLPSLQELKDRTGRSGFLDDDSHFSVEGHEVAARSMAEFLAAQGLVP